MTRVGVVGTGAMGSRIALRLLGAGHAVTLWNRSPEKLAPLVSAGAMVAATPAGVAGASEVLVTMLSDRRALEEVATGPDGIAAGAAAIAAGAAGPAGPAGLAGAAGDLLVVEMSTVAPEAVAALRSWLPASTGLIDAPVLGSLSEVESGSLVVFAGGPEALLRRAEPIFSCLGSVIPTGSLGSGAAAKLVANSTLFTSLTALGEAVSLARSLGLPDAVTFEVLARTPLASQAARRRETIDGGPGERRFALSLAAKDATLIAGAAGSAGERLPVTSGATGWLTRARSEQEPDDPDYSAVLGTILGAGVPPTTPAGAASVRPSPPDGPGATSSPTPPAAAATISARDWDGLVLDLDGVVWRGGDPIEGAVAAVATLRAAGVGIVFVTNDPTRSAGELAAALTEIGIEASPEDVVTATEAVVEVLTAGGRVPGRVLAIGAESLRRTLAGAGCELVPPGEVTALAVAGGFEAVVIGGHEGFDYGELRAATWAVLAGAPLIATSRDALFPAPDGPWPATGAIIAAVEAATGVTSIVAGKPAGRLFEMARRRLQRGPGATPRVAVVGDHLLADIAGGAAAGLATVLVLTGIATADDLERAAVRPDLVVASLAELARTMTDGGIE